MDTNEIETVTCTACEGRGWNPPAGMTVEEARARQLADLQARPPTPGMAARIARIEAERAAARAVRDGAAG
jgi:hypothetical protein